MVTYVSISLQSIISDVLAKMIQQSLFNFQFTGSFVKYVMKLFLNEITYTMQYQASDELRFFGDNSLTDSFKYYLQVT